MSMLTSRWTTPAALNADNRAGWLALLEASFTPNPFYSPDFLVASEAHLTGGMPIRCLVIEQGEALRGVFPLRRPALTDGQFGCFWQLYTNPYLCLTDPLLEADNAPRVLAQALTALRDMPGPNLLRASQMGEQMANLFAEALPEGSLSPISRHSRAALSLLRDELPLRSPSLQRKARKLARHGLMKTYLEPGGTLAFRDQMEAFLHLEAKGWKGNAETALRSRRITTLFAREAFSSHAMLECLLLDGKLIAGNLDLVAGNVVFTVKTAFDPDLAEFSPGLLLDTDGPGLMHKTGTFQRLDSCANPGHPLEQYWPERITIEDCVISLTGNPAAARRGGRWIAGARKLRHRILHPV